MLTLEGQSLGLALQFGTSKELEKKLKIILEYKEKGFIIEGSALGLALQLGTSKELEKKLEIILDYKNEIKLEGTSLGLALQLGTSKELKEKLKIILDYKKKGIILEGQALGLALQVGTSEELGKKLKILYKQEKYFLKIIDSKNLSGDYYKETFIKNFKRVFIYTEKNLKNKNIDSKNLFDLKILKEFNFNNFENKILEKTQNFNLQKELKKELKSNFNGAIDSKFLECIISYFTGNIHVSKRNKATLIKVFTGGEIGHGGKGKLSLGNLEGDDNLGVINIDSISDNSTNPENLSEFEEDKEELIKWFGNKNIIITYNNAYDYINIIRNIINGEKEIGEMLDSAFENLENIDELVDLLNGFE